MKLPFLMTELSLTIYLNGGPRTALAGSVQYNQLKEAILKDDWAIVPGLLMPGGALAKYLGDRFSVSGDTISYDGVALPTTLIIRIQTMANAGADPSPLLRFYERLHKNPSWRSREQVFSFLQHLNIAIEPDGTFLAYKGVNEDYTDRHTGKIPNSPGQVHEMARNLISDDPNTACHYGFHVGALEYASGFGSIVVICRVDPEHVVCVPYDSSAQKMRVCRYEVVGEWSGEAMGISVDSEDLPEEYFVEGWEDEEDLVWDDPLWVAEAVTEVKIRKIKPPKFNAMNSKDLMGCTIKELRKYAKGYLKIVGASKIPGGKAALVSQIMKVRRRLEK